MSVVTDLLLAVSAGEKEDAILETLKEFKVNGKPFHIVSVNDVRLPKFWYGGTKGLGSSLFIGAYNYLDLSLLIKFLHDKVNWADPEDVQLIVKEENDFKFRIIDIFPELK